MTVSIGIRISPLLFLATLSRHRPVFHLSRASFTRVPRSSREDQAMPAELVMLPPQTDKTREWGARLAAALPEMKVIVAENHTHAAGVIAHADAAFGTIPPD